MSRKIFTTKDLKKHYEKLFINFGNSYKTAQQSSRKTQKKRISILVDKLKFTNNTKVLDFGCGTAYLYKYLLKSKKFNGYYTGIDIAENIIAFNKQKYVKNKKINFFCEDILMKKNHKSSNYDYIFVSGTFNNKLNDNWNFMKKILKKLFFMTKKTLIFNNLSTYVDYYDNGLFYIEPEKVFKFCKMNLSEFVEIRHDYQIKEKVIPFEFTTYVYKKN